MKRRITAKDQYTTYADYPLVAGDVRAYEICLDLGDDVAGAEFKVTAYRADGQVVEDIGTVENGTALYTMAANMYSVPGELTVRLAVLHDMSVLTDREIVFEVLSGADDVIGGENVVPINDSVILRVGSIEQKLFDKVDKVTGKGLSSNDFTDEYKEKLDGLDETVGKEVERISESVDNLSDSFDEHKKSRNNPHGVTAGQVGAYTKDEADGELNKKANKTDVYTKSEINEYLDKKANKSDISSVYRFKGSVENFEDLNKVGQYKLVPDGAPVYVDGENHEVICGTFENGTVTVNTILYENLYEIRIPIKDITLPKGYYIHTGNMDVGMYHAGIRLGSDEIDRYTIRDDQVFKLDEDTTITEAYITRRSEEGFEGCAGDVVCTFTQVPQWCVDEVPSAYNRYNVISYDFLEDLAEIGDVYNVNQTGMNYAWNGAEWDALGGEHKDIAAHMRIGLLTSDVEDIMRDVDELKNQSDGEAILGDIDEALDYIIRIQNSLIGGDSV